nr:hypothetical protein [Tanacetum cinerariifolium]
MLPRRNAQWCPSTVNGGASILCGPLTPLHAGFDRRNRLQDDEFGGAGWRPLVVTTWVGGGDGGMVVVGRGAPPAHEPRDVETIERLQQRIQELEFQQLQQVSPAEDTKTECNVWDDGSEDVNPFGGGNPLLTKETESKLIIWDIGDEEEEYPFVNKYPSFKEEPIMFVEDESCPVNDTDNEEEDGDKDEQTEKLLAMVDQSPNSLIQEAVDQPTKALFNESLLKHSSMDVRASVASCIGEITRIIAPYASYGDDEMKEVFQLVVSSLEDLSDESSRSYPKRVSIVENIAKVKSCLIVLELECDDLMVEMFEHFMKSVWNACNLTMMIRSNRIMRWILGRWTRAYHLKVPPPPMPPQQPREGPCQRILPIPRGVNMIVWSLDNRFILAAIMDSRICVWNAVDGSLVHSLTCHNESTYVLDVHTFNLRITMIDGKFSPDGTSIVLSDEVGQLYILSTGHGEEQNDAKYDEFFLGDYMPLIQDVHGNVLDQETQLAPYRRNMQDLLYDSRMIPPSLVRFVVGTDIYLIDQEYQVPPIVDLDILMDPLPKFLDAMDWEPGIEVHSDDNDSEYNSKTKKIKAEADFMTSSGRRVKRRNLDGEESSLRDDLSGKLRFGKQPSMKNSSRSKVSRPRRAVARNVLSFLSRISRKASDGEEHVLEGNSESKDEKNSRMSFSQVGEDDAGKLDLNVNLVEYLEF